MFRLSLSGKKKCCVLASIQFNLTAHFPNFPSQAPGRHVISPRLCSLTFWRSIDLLVSFRLLSNETTGGRVITVEFHRWLLLLSPSCVHFYPLFQFILVFLFLCRVLISVFMLEDFCLSPSCCKPPWRLSGKAYIRNKLDRFGPPCPGWEHGIHIRCVPVRLWAEGTSGDSDSCGATQEICSGIWQTPAMLEGHRKMSWHPEHHVSQPHLQGSFAKKLVYYNELYRTEILEFWYCILAAHLWNNVQWTEQRFGVGQTWVWTSGRRDKRSLTRRCGPHCSMVLSLPHQRAPHLTRSLHPDPPSRTWQAPLRELCKEPNSLLHCSSRLSDLTLNVM